MSLFRLRAPLAWAALLPLTSCSPPSPPIDVAPLTGRQIFMQRCVSCHQPDGSGIPGLYPPLSSSPTLSGPPEALIRLLLQGQKGTVIREGKSYQGVMPAWRFDLDDAQIAGVINDLYIRWRPKAPPVTAEMVAAQRRQTETHPLFPSPRPLELDKGQ